MCGFINFHCWDSNQKKFMLSELEKKFSNSHEALQAVVEVVPA